MPGSIGGGEGSTHRPSRSAPFQPAQGSDSTSRVVPPGYGQGSSGRDIPRVPPPPEPWRAGDPHGDAPGAPPERVGSGPGQVGEAGREMGVAIRHLEEAVDVLREMLATLRETLSPDTMDVSDQLAAAEELLPLVEDQLDDCRAYDQGGSGQDPAVSATLASRGAAIAGSAKSAKRRWHNLWWKKVWEALKSAASWLLVAICRLTTVKEWTFNGQVGTGMLGFAQAGFTVTFGRSDGSSPNKLTLSRQQLRRAAREIRDQPSS